MPIKDLYSTVIYTLVKLNRQWSRTPAVTLTHHLFMPYWDQLNCTLLYTPERLTQQQFIVYTPVRLTRLVVLMPVKVTNWGAYIAMEFFCIVFYLSLSLPYLAIPSPSHNLISSLIIHLSLDT